MIPALSSVNSVGIQMVSSIGAVIQCGKCVPPFVRVHKFIVHDLVQHSVLCLYELVSEHATLIHGVAPDLWLLLSELLHDVHDDDGGVGGQVGVDDAEKVVSGESHALERVSVLVVVGCEEEKHVGVPIDEILAKDELLVGVRVLTQCLHCAHRVHA